MTAAVALASHSNKLVELEGLEPTCHNSSKRSTIPSALRTIAQGLTQLADALDADAGGDVAHIGLASPLTSVTNGHHFTDGQALPNL